MSDDNSYIQDIWPTKPDGTDYDGLKLLPLLKDGCSPFAGSWDVNLLIQEIEDKLAAHVEDIPFISKGSNNYGIHFEMSYPAEVVARLARGDVNMPGFDGFPMEKQVSEVLFEAATYDLLRSQPAILASHLLYHRAPVEHSPPRTELPKDIAGRRLLVFERAKGGTIRWRDPTPSQQAHILAQSASIRAALFNFSPPTDFTTTWFLDRLFEQKPKLLPFPVEPTRDFCIALFETKISSTIKDIGDMIGWEDDNNTVGPRAVACKDVVLRLIPHILPPEIAQQPKLYRLVLDHGDFGIHNMSITSDNYTVTSVFDWETGCIVPAILSDPLMAIVVDLVTDEDAAPSVVRVPHSATSEERVQYMKWATEYIEPLFEKAPEYKTIIKAGKDARHLWFAMRDWRGDDPEGYFGALGEWAAARLGEYLVS